MSRLPANLQRRWASIPALRKKEGASATVALALFPATGDRTGDRSRRASAYRRIPSSDSASPAYVGRGRLQWHSPLVIGEIARCVTTISSVAQKEGRSGELIFLTLKSQLYGPQGLAVTEEKDLVYRNGPASGSRAPTAAERLPMHYGGRWSSRIRFCSSVIQR